MANQELVSVGVLTYNSSNTILETLDSIYNQSYQNIELVISDDCSKDDTVKICREWIAKHNDRFERTIIIANERNKGTSANMNTLHHELRGVWMKGIAGDDVLLPSCIEDCMNYVKEHDAVQWLVGKTKKYIDNIREDCLVKEDHLYTPKRLSALNGSLEEQRRAIVDYSFIEAPAMFMKTEIIGSVGGYNEEYRLIEDWPMHLKLLNAGIKCYFLDKYLVGYRQSANSVFNINSKLFNIGYIESVYKFKKIELYKHHRKDYCKNNDLHYKVCLAFEKYHMNNNKRICRVLYALVNKSIDLIYKK